MQKILTIGHLHRYLGQIIEYEGNGELPIKGCNGFLHIDNLGYRPWEYVAIRDDQEMSEKKKVEKLLERIQEVIEEFQN